MKVLVVGGSVGYADWIQGDVQFLDSTLSNVQHADIVYFTGGEDVDPSVYSCDKNSKTNSNKQRDNSEIKFFNAAKKYGIFMIGTCRGAQLLTALQNRGFLIQHVNGHARASLHEITFNDGDRAVATSTHHQMMYPYNTTHELIAWSTTPLSDVYEFQNGSAIDKLPGDREPEIVYYPGTRALAIQPHPEYMQKTARLVLKLNEILKSKMSYND